MSYELNHADLDRWITRENPAYADPGDYNFEGYDEPDEGLDLDTDGCPEENGDYTPRIDLVAEAGALVDALYTAMGDLHADYAAEGRFPPAAMAYFTRLSIAHMHAERRVMRRIAADLPF